MLNLEDLSIEIDARIEAGECPEALAKETLDEYGFEVEMLPGYCLNNDFRLALKAGLEQRDQQSRREYEENFREYHSQR